MADNNSKKPMALLLLVVVAVLVVILMTTPPELGTCTVSGSCSVDAADEVACTDAGGTWTAETITEGVEEAACEGTWASTATE